MAAEREQTADDYAALAASIEEADYTVRSPATVHRGRPRKGRNRTPSRITSVRISEATLDVVEELASAEGRTTSDLIREAVEQYLARHLPSSGEGPHRDNAGTEAFRG
ncbi:MAG: ribbon-helix-helix protein, CopG family [Gordonia sp. (in: high G+C Gram-positive bacteria)]